MIINGIEASFNRRIIKIVQSLVPNSTGSYISYEPRGFKMVFGECMPIKGEFIRFLNQLSLEETPFFDLKPFHGYSEELN